MSDNDYDHGRWGTGTPNPDSVMYQRGLQARLDEINRQQEAKQAEDQAQILKGIKQFSDALTPPPAPAGEWPGSLNSRSDDSENYNYTPSSYVERNTANSGPYEPSLRDRLVDWFFAPFRLAWKLIKFLFKVALFLAAALLVIILLQAHFSENKVNETSQPARKNGAETSNPTPPRSRVVQPPLADLEASGSNDAQPIASTQTSEAPATSQEENNTVSNATPYYPRIGVRVAEVADEDATQLGLTPQQRGARVSSVFQGSPAEEAHLQPGDIIVSLNDQSVSGRDQFVQLVSIQAVGALVSIEFYRDGVKYRAGIIPR